MLERKMKQFVYTVINKCNKGFTFISLLLTMTIIFTTLPLFVYIVNAVTYTSSYDEISIQQFFNFLQEEFTLALDYSVSKNKVIFYMIGEKNVSFERYNAEVLRKVNNSGHDIYLRDIKDINFTSLPYGIQVEITSLKGETYEKTMVFYGG